MIMAISISSMFRVTRILCIFVLLIASIGVSQAGIEKLSVYEPNPHYFQDKDDNPVYLIGYYSFSFHRDLSSDYKKVLDYHSENKINYVRIINEVKDAGGYSENPYLRGSGFGKTLKYLETQIIYIFKRE